MVQRVTLLLIIVSIFLTSCGRTPAAIENNIPPSRTPTIFVSNTPSKQPTQTREVIPTSIDASPVPESPRYETPVPYPVKTGESIITQVPEAIVTPTSAPVDDIDPANWKWDGCRKNWIENELTALRYPELAGLVFYFGPKLNETLWKIDSTGQPVLLSCIPGSTLSPKSDQVLFRHANDFWLANLLTGSVDQVSNTPDLIPMFFAWSLDQKYIYYNEADSTTFFAADNWVYDTDSKERRQITFSPDVNKGYIHVWPKYSDWIVYEVQNKELGPSMWGEFILANTNRLGGETYTDHPIGRWVSFSPDGELLTYQDHESVKFQHLDQKPTVIQKQEIIVNRWNLRGIANLQWSADGKKLAADATAWKETGEYTGVLIFDPISKQGSFLHPFTPVGSGGSAGWSEWSPNSQWLALVTKDENFDKAGLWVVRADGSEEHYLTTVFGSHFSPDGFQILYSKIGKKRQIWNFDLRTKKSTQTELPEFISIIRWDNR